MNAVIEKLKSHPTLSKFVPENKNRTLLWVAAIVVAGALAFIFDQKPEPATNPNLEPETVEDAATFIPEGYVLVPIEVANSESLDSILGKFGVVDLFVAPLDGQGRPRKVAERVKILRAPLNPRNFAVLAPEKDSQQLVGLAVPLTVVVQNPKSSGMRIVKSDTVRAQTRAPRKMSRVTFEVNEIEDQSDAN